MERQTRREFLKRIGAAAGVALALPGCAGLARERVGAKKQPNIIVIVGDDMGYADISCHGCKDIATPNIDSLAQNGVRFTNGYVTCGVCSPTRAGLVTGRYQQRFGHEFNPGAPRVGTAEDVGLPLNEVTIADVLKSAGYATGIVGKWHLGAAPHFHPLKRGFDEYFGFLGGSHSYTDPGLGSANPIMRGTEPVDEKEYLTDAFTREAIAFIERHKGGPFFLYLTYNAVHAPLEAPQHHKDKFGQISDPKRRVYAGMMTAMDEGIGKLLGKLKEQGLYEDTLIFFVSDNGGPTNNNGSNNTPLRATKATLYEGGIRVPFMIQWPRQLKCGKLYEHSVITLDILPTVAAAAGARISGDRRLDGVNLLPYLAGEKKTPPHEILFWRTGANHAVRRGNWKLVTQGGETGLFDLALDIGESRDLKAEKPQIAKELQEAFEKWNSQLATPLWGGQAARPRRARART